MIYVDTNYWIYWFDQRLPEHQHVAPTMHAAVGEGIVLNLVTLMEVAHYFRSLPNGQVQDRIRMIQNLAKIRLVELDNDIFELALETLAKYARMGLGGRDSVIVATLKATGNKRIATHDTVFRRIEEVEVVDSIPPPTHQSRQPGGPIDASS